MISIFLMAVPLQMLNAKKIELPLIFFASHKKLKGEASELFVYRKEFWAVEVNHVGGVGFYPHLCFPGNVIDMSFEFPKIRKSTDINFSCFASNKRFLQLDLPFGRKRPMRCDRLYQKEKIL